MYWDHRDRFRIKVVYSNEGLFAYWLKWKELGKAHKDFIKGWSSPSFAKLVDNMRRAERDKFWELYKNEHPMDEILPGIGFKTKHRFSDDSVYVLDMGAWGNRAKCEIDPARERLNIFVYKNEGICSYYITQGDIASFLRQASYHANERYVDRLTKKQREAIMFIRMLPEGEYVKGIGAWVRSRYQDGKTYIIDC